MVCFDIRYAKWVPLIATTQIHKWLCGKEVDCFEHVPTMSIPGIDSFAIEAPDDALAPAIQEKDFIIVDPTRRPKVGDYVLAQLTPNMEGFLIRQYIEADFTSDGRRVFGLKPTNPLYASAHSERHNISILGVIRSFNTGFNKSLNRRLIKKQVIARQTR